MDVEEFDVDIIWMFDMYNDFGVFLYNLVISLFVIYEDMIYIVIFNGVDEIYKDVFFL